MLQTYLIGQPLNDSDRAACLEVLPRHPQAAEKVGSGVAEITVEDGGHYGTRFFQIVRTNGTTANFPYLSCISPELEGHDTEVKWAMRCEVMPQTRQFFDDAFRRTAVFCEITGQRLTPKGSHVDHMKPITFQRLARDFLASKNLTLAEIQTSKAPHVLPVHNATSLADRDLAAAWQEYHRTHARLRITSKRANLQERKPHVDFAPTPTLF